MSNGDDGIRNGLSMRDAGERNALFEKGRRGKEVFDLVLFDSAHHSIAFDRKALEYSVGGRLIPVPRTLSASCGMCYRFSAENRGRMDEFLGKCSMEYRGIVRDYPL